MSTNPLMREPGAAHKKFSAFARQFTNLLQDAYL
jgi:hypothetical protein